MKWIVIAINKYTKEIKILKKTDTREEAIKWIDENRHKYPDYELNFIREGYLPVIL